MSNRTFEMAMHTASECAMCRSADATVAGMFAQAHGPNGICRFGAARIHIRMRFAKTKWESFRMEVIPVFDG